MKTIIFIGGIHDLFVTAPFTEFVSALSKEYNVISPNVNYNKPNDIRSSIEECYHSLDIDTQKDVIFLGYSMGGLFAEYFAKAFYRTCVLINPIVAPSVTALNLYDAVTRRVYEKIEKESNLLIKCSDIMLFWSTSMINEQYPSDISNQSQVMVVFDGDHNMPTDDRNIYCIIDSISTFIES